MAGMLPAQDTIYRVDGSKQLGKIIELNPTQLRYVPASNPDGPVFRITKNTVAKIVYEDGSVISFQKIREPEDAMFSEKTRDFDKRNIIAIDFFDPVFLRTFSVSYERLSKSGVWGYKIPLSLGIDNKHKQYRSQKLFSTGIALNFYPFDDISNSFHVGLSGIAGKQEFYRQYYNNQNYWATNRETEVFTILAFNTGYRFNISRDFLLSLQLGIGYEISNNPSTTHIIFPVELNLCYTF